MSHVSHGAAYFLLTGLSMVPLSCALAATPSPAASCEACHGAQGQGMPAAGIPRLAGQSAEYLDKQLRNYADGSRTNPVMTDLALALSATQRTAVSIYYAALAAPYPPLDAVGVKAQLARGQQLAAAGDEIKRVQACNGCHGPDGSGVLHAAPIIGGQAAGYIASSLEAWQQGTRRNDSGQLMQSVALRLDTSDIAAVAAYFANSRP